MFKKYSALLLLMLIACAVQTGCVKDNDGPGLPDVRDLNIAGASAWRAGESAMIYVTSLSLGSGIYRVYYNLTGANTMEDLDTTFTVTDTTGIFYTPVLPAAGETKVTITAITNAAGKTSAVTRNNTGTFSDSIGLMTATVNGAAYRATHVIASKAGSSLAVHAVKWTPLTPIDLFVDVYENEPVQINFTSATDFNGGAHYSSPGNNQFGVHGTISITTSAPLLTGTFRFTNGDSSVVAGSFSCPAP